MNKAIIYSIFVVLYLLVTFFGMGPVLMADGSNTERFVTFIVVLIIYAIITITLIYVKRKFLK